MCFAPQRRALFRHLNLQKVVRHLVCFCAFLTWKCASRHKRRALFRHLNFQSGPNMVCFVHFDFEMCFAPQRRALFSTSQLPKVVRTWCVLCSLTSKSASHHNGVHFFDISTSKSGPNVVCFCTFWLRNVLRATNGVHFFRHLNCQKWSAPVVSCAFWLGNVLRTTNGVHFFQHLNFQKVVPKRGVFDF